MSFTFSLAGRGGCRGRHAFHWRFHDRRWLNDGSDLLNRNELHVFDELRARWPKGYSVNAEPVVVEQGCIALSQALLELT